MDWLQTLAVVLDSMVRLSIPLICAAMAGLWSEKAGVVDIGLEGKMLVAAFAAAVAAYASGSAWVGLGAGILASVALALLHGFAAIAWRGNQIVSGVAVNMLAAGLSVVLGNAWYGQGGRTPSLEGAAPRAAATAPRPATRSFWKAASPSAACRPSVSTCAANSASCAAGWTATGAGAVRSRDSIGRLASEGKPLVADSAETGISANSARKAARRRSIVPVM